jgi:hypothetical protein
MNRSATSKRNGFDANTLEIMPQTRKTYHFSPVHREFWHFFARPDGAQETRSHPDECTANLNWARFTPI